MKLAPQIISSHRKMPLHVPLGSRLEGRKREDFLLQSDSQRCTMDKYDPADRQKEFIGVKGVYHGYVETCQRRSGSEDPLRTRLMFTVAKMRHSPPVFFLRRRPVATAATPPKR